MNVDHQATQPAGASAPRESHATSVLTQAPSNKYYFTPQGNNTSVPPRPTPPAKKGNKWMKGCLIGGVVVVVAGIILVGVGGFAAWYFLSDHGSTEEVVEEITEVEAEQPLIVISDNPTVTYNPATRTFECDANGGKMQMIKVDGGTFEMGATAQLAYDAKENEWPVHTVTLSPYYIASTEVPQWLYQAVMGNNPSVHTGDLQPVENVSWNDCQQFISNLNSLTGCTFALPTEAQWEFAAREGKSDCIYLYSGSNSIGDVGWTKDNSGGTPSRVAALQPNALGIYDMTGNVFEWCSDYHGDYSYASVTDPTGPSSGSRRSGRGGSFKFAPKFCRISFRAGTPANYKCDDLGMRLSCKVD